MAEARGETGTAAALLAEGAARVAEAWAAGHRDAGAVEHGLLLSSEGAMRLIARVVQRWRGTPQSAPPAHPESLLGEARSGLALPAVVAALAALERRICTLVPGHLLTQSHARQLAEELDLALAATVRRHLVGPRADPIDPDVPSASTEGSGERPEGLPILARSMADLSHLMAQVPVPQALLVGPDLRQRIGNRAWRDLHDGVGDGEPLSALWADGAANPVVAAAAAALRRGSGCNLRDVPLRPRRSTRERVVNARIYLMGLGDFPDTTMVLLVLDDVTEQVEARRAAQQARAALEVERDNVRALFDRAELVMSQMEGPELRYVYCNPAHVAMVGEDLTGKALAQRAPLGGDGEATALQRVVATGQALLRREVRVTTPDGERFFSVSCVPRRAAAGVNDGIMVVAADVTQTVLARQTSERLVAQLAAASQVLGQQAAADRQFRRIFETAHIGLALCDEAVCYLEVNHAYERITGYTQAELRGRNVAEITHPADRDVGARPEGTSPSTPAGDVSFEKRYRHKQGHWIWVSISIAFLPATADQPLRRIGIVQDITERKEHDAREQAVQSELRRAIRARDDFLSVASHELKTPLTPLILLGQRAHRRLAAGADASQAIASLCRQVDVSVGQMVRLIDDMLDVSRLTHGKLSLRRQRVDLAELTRQTVDRLRPAAAQGDTTLTFAGPTHLEVECDAFRIEQVLTNLVHNALRYGERSPVHIDLTGAAGRVLLSVRDRGPGIAASLQPKVFERFERGTNPDAPTGLGLGLFICREIAERHGGGIELQSTPGQGAAFTVWLPAGPRPAPRARP